MLKNDYYFLTQKLRLAYVDFIVHSCYFENNNYDTQFRDAY